MSSIEQELLSIKRRLLFLEKQNELLIQKSNDDDYSINRLDDRLHSLESPDQPIVKYWLNNEQASPTYAHEGDSCADLRACENVEIPPGERKLIHTGLYIQLPPGYECQVRPRSGLAVKQGFTVLNSPGSVDNPYRGEVAVIGINHDLDNPVVIKAGDRIAQLAFVRIGQVVFERVDSQAGLEDSSRGTAGFGSTGV